MPVIRFPALALAALCLAACASSGPVGTGEAPTVLVLVRHAEKGTAPSGDPALLPEGEARAEALATALADAGIEVVIGSQFRRTTDTAAPLAARLGLEVQSRPLASDDPGASAAALALDVAREYAGRTVLVVGHSNTIPSMIAALTGRPMADLDDADYDNLFIVVREGGETHLFRTRFGAADPVP